MRAHLERLIVLCPMPIGSKPILSHAEVMQPPASLIVQCLRLQLRGRAVPAVGPTRALGERRWRGGRSAQSGYASPRWPPCRFVLGKRSLRVAAVAADAHRVDAVAARVALDIHIAATALQREARPTLCELANVLRVVRLDRVPETIALVLAVGSELNEADGEEIA